MFQNEVDDSNYDDDLGDKHYVYFIWAGGSYETDLIFWTIELKYYIMTSLNV